MTYRLGLEAFRALSRESSPPMSVKTLTLGFTTITESTPRESSWASHLADLGPRKPIDTGHPRSEDRSSLHDDPHSTGISSARPLLRSPPSLQWGHIAIPRRTLSLPWKEDPKVCTLLVYAAASIGDTGFIDSLILHPRRQKM